MSRVSSIRLMATSPVAFAPPVPGLVANVLDGSAHGLELAVARRAETGLSGSIGYAYGVARYTDRELGETFDADFDQRHALNAIGSVPLPWASRADVTDRRTVVRLRPEHAYGMLQLPQP